jgi:quercetin dioxygenase-like cupin family protein
MAALSNTLIKPPDVEVIRMVLLAGEGRSEPNAPDEIMVQCLEGDIALTAMKAPERLRAGGMVYVAAGEANALELVEDSSFLLTIMRPEASPQS